MAGVTVLAVPGAVAFLEKHQTGMATTAAPVAAPSKAAHVDMTMGLGLVPVPVPVPVPVLVLVLVTADQWISSKFPATACTRIASRRREACHPWTRWLGTICSLG